MRVWRVGGWVAGVAWERSERDGDGEDGGVLLNVMRSRTLICV